LSAPLVVHFIETDIPGGAESFLFDLCIEQRARGLRPMIGHFGHPWFEQRCRETGIETFGLPERARFKKIATLPGFALDFARRLRHAGAELLHSHLFGPIVGGSLTAFLGRIPHVGTLHDIYMVQEVPSRIRQLQVALAFGTRLVAVSNQMSEFYRERVAWRRDRIAPIHNGIRPPRTETPVTRESLSIARDDVVLICVGRLIPLKRVQDAIQALRSIDGAAAATLVVVGEGPELPQLQALAAQLGVAERVKFLGARRDVPALLRISDIFLQCSDTEGLSMSIIEALHAGLPCIVTQVGGNPELVRQDENGALYRHSDLAALTALLRRFATDGDLRRRMGERSRQIAQQEFTIEACTGKYISLYQSLGLQPHGTYALK
jgi:glycosyltransferase involved in cell wall biosynthesis